MLSDVTIHDRQLAVHKSTEALSVFVLAPILLWAGLRGGRMTPFVRFALVAGGLSAILVDGWLLSRWPKEK